MKANLILVLELSLSAVCFMVFFLWSHALKKPEPGADGALLKKYRGTRKKLMIGMLIALWFFVGVLLSRLAGGAGKLNVSFDMFSTRVTLFGISFAETSLISVAITLILTVFCLIFRLFLFPRFKEKPKGLQNVLELMVEAMDNFCSGVVGDLSKVLSPYMLTIAFFMVLSAASELFSLRAPTSDLTVTFAMGLITFFLINYHGIRKKGLKGRIAALAKPTPLIFPIKIISDMAVPVSLACRLFGNMLGGMIVMDLLKGVLGGYRSGVTAAAGLYFNLFHPLIQTYIFIVLSLTFIDEAVE